MKPRGNKEEKATKSASDTGSKISRSPKAIIVEKVSKVTNAAKEAAAEPVTSVETNKVAKETKVSSKEVKTTKEAKEPKEKASKETKATTSEPKASKADAKEPKAAKPDAEPKVAKEVAKAAAKPVKEPKTAKAAPKQAKEPKEADQSEALNAEAAAVVPEEAPAAAESSAAMDVAAEDSKKAEEASIPPQAEQEALSAAYAATPAPTPVPTPLHDLVPQSIPSDVAMAVAPHEMAAPKRLPRERKSNKATTPSEKKQAARERWMARLKPEVAELLFSNPEGPEPATNEELLKKLVVDHQCSERMLRALCNIGQTKYKRLRKILQEAHPNLGNSYFYGSKDRTHFETFIGAYIEVFFEKKDVPFVSWASVHKKYNAARTEEGLKIMSYSAFVRFRRLCFPKVRTLNLKRQVSDGHPLPVLLPAPVEVNAAADAALGLALIPDSAPAPEVST